MLRNFDTRQSEHRHRIESWRTAVSDSLVHVDCAMPRPAEFEGAFSLLTAGQCGLATLRGSMHVATRDRACIRRSGGDFFMVFLQQSGWMGAAIGDQEFTIRPGDFFFYDASLPHRLTFAEPFVHIALKVPRRLVSENWRSLLQRGCFQHTPRDALCRIAAATLEASADSIGRMSEDDLAIAVENVIDLFAAGHGKVGSVLPRYTRGADVTLARARAVIQSRLRDSDLSPDTVAAEMRISRRSLNKLFEKEGIGAMEYIIVERLDQAARDLSSPLQRSLSVTDIAFRWGFKNTSHFAKRFRHRFGRMPSELRHH